MEYWSSTELVYLVTAVGLLIAVVIAVPMGMALAKIIEWLVDRLDI
jgi:hypothetical protein